MPKTEPFKRGELDDAFEKLILRKNGNNKTIEDVVELLIAMHHDSKARDGRLFEVIDKHLTDDVRMTNMEFKEFMQKIQDKRQAELQVIRNSITDVESRIEGDIGDIKANCTLLHSREPRRHTDPETEEWGLSVMGEEGWEIRKAWRFLKYVVAGIIGVGIVVVGEEIAHSFGLE